MNNPTRFTYLQTRKRTRREPKWQIDALEAKIADLRADFTTESQEKVAALRPIMVSLHRKILVIQKQLADLWNAHSAERPEAEGVFAAKVADLEVQIHTLKEESSKAASFLAPIRRLPWKCSQRSSSSPFPLMRTLR